MKENTFITITRQYGSGGLAIAQEVAKRLGAKCYNRDIVAQAAENIQNLDDIDSVLKESYDTPNNFVGMISWLAGQSVPRQNQMYIEQAKIILELAKRGTAVFVGRCADYILREQPNRYSIFIYADDEYRRKVVQEVYKDSSLQDVRDVDAQRKRYYAYYTGQTWGDPKNYDLMINSTNISTEIAADLIMKYVELRQK